MLRSFCLGQDIGSLFEVEEFSKAGIIRCCCFVNGIPDIRYALQMELGAGKPLGSVLRIHLPEGEVMIPWFVPEDRVSVIHFSILDPGIPVLVYRYCPFRRIQDIVLVRPTFLQCVGSLLDIFQDQFAGQIGHTVH